MAIDHNNNNNAPERNGESPFHREISEAGNKLAEQAHHLMKEFKFETPAENPGGNPDIAGMLGNFGIFDGSEQQHQAGDQSYNSQNPMEQNLMHALTGGQAPDSAQEAAFEIGKEVASGLMGALQGLGDDGSSDSGSDSNDGLNGADASNGLDSTNTGDSVTSDGSAPSDDESQNDSSMPSWPPAWMSKFASAELAGKL